MMTNNLPRHIAIIMDGNGRWAKKRFLPRLAGHRAGVEAAKSVIKWCVAHQVEVLSLFAFSSENWRRPQEEVNHLMQLFLQGLQKELPLLQKQNIQLRFIGNRDRFDVALRTKIDEVEELVKDNTGMVLLVAADYGGQWDICQAVEKLIANNDAEQFSKQGVTADMLAKYLSFADLPDPDLFIRTSGELRISNFMLWQLAYSELYFTEVLWPDFGSKEMEAAVQHFAKRQRRFGKSGDQIEQS